MAFEELSIVNEALKSKGSTDASVETTDPTQAEQTEVPPIDLENIVPRTVWAPNPAGEQSNSRFGGGMHNSGSTNSGAGRR